MLRAIHATKTLCQPHLDEGLSSYPVMCEWNFSPEAVVKSHKEGSSLPPLPADKNISCVHLNVQCQTEALCQNPCSLIGWLRFKMAVESALPCLLTSKMADLPATPPEATRGTGYTVERWYRTFLNKMKPAHLC